MAYASLIVGGFLVMTYFAFAYFAIWRHEILPVFPDGPNRFAERNPSNSTTIPFGSRGFREQTDPIYSVVSPQAVGIFLVGMLLTADGFFALRHLRQKENHETRKFVISSLLTDEERSVYDALCKAGGQLTQKQLGMQSGFSPVKTYRVIRRLESKKIVKSFPFGMTKKVMLNEA